VLGCSPCIFGDEVDWDYADDLQEHVLQLSIVNELLQMSHYRMLMRLNILLGKSILD
jgi:hypothetical protein